jgi:hypothetical protein
MTTERLPVASEKAFEYINMFNFCEPYMHKKKNEFCISTRYAKMVNGKEKREYPSFRLITEEITLNSHRCGIPSLFDETITNEKYLANKSIMPKNDNDNSRSKFRVVYDDNQKSLVDLKKLLSTIDTNIRANRMSTWKKFEEIINKDKDEDDDKVVFKYNNIVSVNKKNKDIISTNFSIRYNPKADDFNPDANIMLLQSKDKDGNYVTLPCKTPTDIFNAVPINSTIIMIFEIGYGWKVNDGFGVKLFLEGIRVVEKGDPNALYKSQ